MPEPAPAAPPAPAPAAAGARGAQEGGVGGGRTAAIRSRPRAAVPQLGRLRRWGAVLAALGLWELTARLSSSPLYPAFSEVARQLWTDIAGGLVWYHARLTLFRGFLGLLIAVVLGVLLGVLMGRNRVVEATLQPVIAASYPIPRLALFPILILLLGFGGPSKIALVALECIYPIAYNTYEGVRSVNRQFVWLARNVGAGPVAVSGVTLRSALPAILSGIRNALPVMLVIMVVTELLGESRGLGFLIRDAQANFLPAAALGIVLLLGLIGFVLDRGVVALTSRLVFWQRSARV